MVSIKLVNIIIVMLITVFKVYSAENRYTYFYAQKAFAECRYDDALALYNASYVIDNYDVSTEIKLCKSKIASENSKYPDWMKKCKIVPLENDRFLAVYFFYLGYGGCTYEDAKNYIDDFRLGGFSDWSMPSLEQIELIEKAIALKHINLEPWTESGMYWLKDNVECIEYLQSQNEDKNITVSQQRHFYYVPPWPGLIKNPYSIIDMSTGNYIGSYTTPEIEVNPVSNIFMMVREFDGSSYNISDNRPITNFPNSILSFSESGVFEKDNGNLYILVHKDEPKLNEDISDYIVDWVKRNKHRLKSQICHILLFDNWCQSGIDDEDAWKISGSVSDLLERIVIPKRYYNWCHATRKNSLYNFGDELYKDAIWLNLIVIDRDEQPQVLSRTPEYSEPSDTSDIKVTGTVIMKTKVKTHFTWKNR